MRIFLTGISGLLGTNLSMILLEKGYLVTGLVRKKSAFVGTIHKNLKLVEGDLFSNIDDHLKACQLFVHAAAITDPRVKHYSEFKKINVDATTHLAKSCIRCGVKQFIFVSTAATIGFGTKLQPGQEGNDTSNILKKLLYVRSKLKAEKALEAFTNKIEIGYAHPTFMIGSYDSKPSSGKLILLGLGKSIFFYPPGGKNFVHVKDVADGIISMIEKRVNNAHFLLANENLTYKEFFTKMNTVAGQKPIMIKAPRLLIFKIGLIGDILRTFGIRTNSSSVNVKILNLKTFYSNRKSIEQLNIQYRPIESALKEAISYFKETGKA